MKTMDALKEETYVSPKIAEFQIIPSKMILQNSDGNTEPIDDGGNVPGF